MSKTHLSPTPNWNATPLGATPEVQPAELLSIIAANRASMESHPALSDGFEVTDMPNISHIMHETAQLGVKAYKQGMISAQELTTLGDEVVTAMLGVAGSISRDTADLSKSRWPDPGDIYGFGLPVRSVTSLFNLTNEFEPPTPEQEVSRVSALLAFDSDEQPYIFDDFVNKYGDELAGKGDNAEAISKIWESSHFLVRMPDWLKVRKNKQGPTPGDWPETDRKIYSRVFEAFGFSAAQSGDIQRALYSASPGKKNQTAGARLDNVSGAWKILAQIHSIDPKAPQDIYKRFGIRNFQRYNSFSLHRQLETFRKADEPGYDKSDKEPFSLVITGTDDHNGALKKVSGNFSVNNAVFMEAKSLTEVARNLVTVKKVGQVGTLVVYAHGNKRSILLGGDLKDGFLVTKRQLLRSKSLKSIKNKGIFTDDADIVIISCSTGKRGGIAQTISRASDISVTAPKIPSNASIYQTGDRKKGGSMQHEVRFETRARRSILGMLGLKGALHDTNAGITYTQGDVTKRPPRN